MTRKISQTMLCFVQGITGSNTSDKNKNSNGGSHDKLTLGLGTTTDMTQHKRGLLRKSR